MSYSQSRSRNSRSRAASVEAEAEVSNQSIVVVNEPLPNIPNYPSMPKLESTSNTHFSAWKEKTMNYMDQHGLREVITSDGRDSLTSMIQLFGENRKFSTILPRWFERQQRVFALIRAAVENAIGLQLFRDLEHEANSEGTMIHHLISKALSPESGEADDPTNWDWMDEFRFMNPKHLWSILIQKYETYTGSDKMRMIRNYFNIPKYKEGEDPIQSLKLFHNRVNELTLAGISMHEDVHWAIWLDLIPESMKHFRTTLASKTSGTYLEVYEAIKNQHNQPANVTPSKTKHQKEPEDSQEQGYMTKEKVENKEKL